MKKKIATTILMVFIMPLFSSAISQAKAASLEDRLAEVGVGKPTASQIQELIKIPKTLTSDDKQLLASLAKTALERVGKADMLKELTSLSQQLPTQELTGVNGTVVNAVETAIRDKLQNKIQEEVTNRLAGYQDKLTLLSPLLNNRNILTPKAVQDNNALTGEPQNYRKLLTMTATAYGPGPLDNGKWNNLTYVGGSVKKGVAAVDPAVIPIGTKLWIEGYGEAVAEDQGSAIKGNRIDLAFNTRQEALDYGIKNVKVYVLK